jgi:pilus assembly protein CpaE
MAASTDLSQELLLQALQSGVMEVVAKPIDPPQLFDALARTLLRADRTEVSEEQSGARGRILAFFGAKGGVGTTAIATNLAVEVHRMTGEKTLLLDLDLEQGEAALLLGMEPTLSLLDLLRNFQPEVSSLLAACIDHDPRTGIGLLSAPMRGASVQPADYDLLTGEGMRRVLAFLKEHYRYIVIDRPKSFHPAFTCVLEEADDAYLVTTPDLQGLRNITRSVTFLGRVSGSLDPGHFHLVVNRYATHPAITLAEIQDAVGMPIYHSLAADFFPLNESIRQHTPIVMNQTSQFARDVRALAAKVIGKAGAEPRKGLMDRLIGAMRGR